jgi:hypothetical protein
MRLVRFFGNVLSVIRFFGVTRCGGYVSYDSLLLWDDVYFESRFPYIFVKYHYYILFIIFSEEDGVVYIDVFHRSLPRKKTYLDNALKLCYGITKDTVRLQGDLFLKYIPLDKIPVDSCKELFLDSLSSYFFGIQFGVWQDFSRVLLDYTKNTKLLLYMYLYSLISSSYHQSKKLVDYLKRLECVSSKIMFLIMRKHKFLLKKKIDFENMLYTQYFAFLTKIPLEISIRRLPNGNPHTVSVKGFLIDNILVPNLHDLIDLPRVSNVYAFFVSGDQELVAKHPEHGVSKYYIPKDGILILYLPG